MRKSKVFIGLSNIANISYTMALALRQNGVQADYVSLTNSDKIFDYKYQKELFQFSNGTFPKIAGKNSTAIINTSILYGYFIIALMKYNTFIFISPGSFLPLNKDLPILKFFKKKIVFIFAGCPERDIDFMPNNLEYICNRCNEENKKVLCKCNDISDKKSLVRKLESYSDYIISQDDSAGYLVNIKPIWFYVISELPEKMDYLKKYNSDKIVIVHIPSNPQIKLSHIIIPVLEKIRDENSTIELIIESGIPHQKVIDYLTKSHIVVDALGLGYGVLAIEGLSRGCIAVTGKMDFIENAVPNNPVINSTCDSLYYDLSELINNRKELKSLAQKSIDFYYKYHTLETAGLYYKEKLNLK